MNNGIKKISENVIKRGRSFIITNTSLDDSDAIDNGAIWSDSIDKTLKIKTALNTVSLINATGTLEDGSISTSLIANNAITESKIAINAITESRIKDNAVTSLKIADNAITERKIMSGSVTNSKIANNSVSSSKIQDNSVTESKIADRSVNYNKIAFNSITEGLIQNNAITSLKIRDYNILNRHISNKAITGEKIADGSILGINIKSASISQSHLADNAVAANKILNGAVTSTKIANGAILEKHLGAASVGELALGNSSVSESKIKDGSISSVKIKDKAITKTKLADDVLNLIGDNVKYDSSNNVSLKRNLKVAGDIAADGYITANKVYNPVYADIAEGYIPETDCTFKPGDIVSVNEDGKLVKAKFKGGPIVGVVSDEYAMCLGATVKDIDNLEKIPVGLIGKVHVTIAGAVSLGDSVLLLDDGIGMSTESVAYEERRYVIGKALESNKNNGIKKVLCLISPSV